MSKVYIYSTLSAAVEYPVDGSPELIRIEGDAGIPDKRLTTSRGAVTEVTDDQYRALQENHVFNLHVKNGYLVADTKKHKADDVAADLNENDKSRPDTPESLAADGQPVPSTEKVKK